jgi:DnaJ-class molecular chaperone
MSARGEFLKTVKPAAAQRAVPEGHVATVTCPTCKGKGKVAKDPDLTARMLKRV